MSAAVSAHSLLMTGRVIVSKWCSSGHVLQAEAGRECDSRQQSIWNSSPTSFFFYVTPCPTLLWEIKYLACNLRAVLCAGECLISNKNHQVEDTMTRIASLQELFLVSLIAGVGAEALGMYRCSDCNK